MKIVTTINGEKLPKKQTRYISGNYYKIGDNKVKDSGDCYFINDKYYRIDTGYIIYDHRVGEYVVFNKDQYITKGIVDFDEEDNPIFGGFSIRNDTDIIEINIEGTRYILLNEDIVKKTKLYLEDLRTGIYENRYSLPSHSFVLPVVCDRDYKNTLPYDCREILKSRQGLFEGAFEEKDISYTIKQYAPYLRDLTFGFEFETNKGVIPKRICKKLGLIALRDGSIDGLEYVTIPLQGASGIQAVIESLQQLNKRTTYDNSCSLHLHIGNIPRTEEFILALFKTLCFVQDDIFSLFPLYKKYNFGYKRKHYTKPFDLNKTLLLMDNKIDETNIKENFNILFEYLSNGIPYSNYNNDLRYVESHPSDPNGTSKWNIRSRYMAHNIIPLIFGNKQTVEFRIHTPTYDIDKVMYFLFLCGSIVNFAKKYTNKILSNPKFLRNINLNNIIYKVGLPSSLENSLTRYIADRTNFAHHKNAMSKIHFNEDDYQVSYDRIDWLGDNKKRPKVLTFSNEYNSTVVEENLADQLRELANFEFNLMRAEMEDINE